MTVSLMSLLDKAAFSESHHTQDFKVTPALFPQTALRVNLAVDEDHI